MGRTPDVELRVYFVEHGIQADVFIDGSLGHSILRDFGDDQELDKLKAQFLSYVYTMLNLFIGEQSYE